MSSGDCLAAAMCVTERAPHLFTETTACGVWRVLVRAVDTCIANKYFCSGTSCPLHLLENLWSCDKGYLSDVPRASRLLGAAVVWDKAAPDPHRTSPSETGDEQEWLRSLAGGRRGEAVSDGYPFKMHLTEEPGFVIVLRALRFPLRTITNTPFFETAASPAA